ncbi:hypothetical protein CBR_g11117 [Chara braunii]|uniref:Uncharacterized protein n=1 Tax=Chara braunii TaxID=69332 RepID=A0A388KQ51_CHABU|nr:hypothetical protein CBR_g11117 [Chara braunii]|eukprot:GBG72184.1 hypothetical protein CBR_g11117 [Chara braunii]
MTDCREAQTDGQRPWLLPADEFVELVPTPEGLPRSSRTRQWLARRRRVKLGSGQHGAIESNTSAATCHMAVVESNSTTAPGICRVRLDVGSTTWRWSTVEFDSTVWVHRRVGLDTVETKSTTPWGHHRVRLDSGRRLWRFPAVVFDPTTDGDGLAIVESYSMVTPGRHILSVSTTPPSHYRVRDVHDLGPLSSSLQHLPQAVVEFDSTMACGQCRVRLDDDPGPLSSSTRHSTRQWPVVIVESDSTTTPGHCRVRFDNDHGPFCAWACTPRAEHDPTVVFNSMIVVVIESNTTAVAPPDLTVVFNPTMVAVIVSSMTAVAPRNPTIVFNPMTAFVTVSNTTAVAPHDLTVMFYPMTVAVIVSYMTEVATHNPRNGRCPRVEHDRGGTPRPRRRAQPVTVAVLVSKATTCRLQYDDAQARACTPRAEHDLVVVFNTMMVAVIVSNTTEVARPDPTVVFDATTVTLVAAVPVVMFNMRRSNVDVIATKAPSRSISRTSLIVIFNTTAVDMTALETSRG